jgi:hypothetical protein
VCLRTKLDGDMLEATILFEEIGRRRSSSENGSLGTFTFEILALT